MKCQNCESSRELKKEKRDLKYTECGLSNIVLVNATVFKCSNCSEEYYDYGNINELHKLIAGALISQASILTGPEIRFLRKHTGYSKDYFAEVLGVQERTVYRWEKGENITPQVDKAIRMAIALTQPDRDYDYHDYMLKKKEAKKFSILKILFSPKGYKLHFT